MLRRLFSITLLAAFLLTGIFMILSEQSIAAAQKNKNDLGRKLFMNHCASCHGSEAKGDGPAALALKTAPPDLTRIAKVDGKFPALKVKRIIGGDDLISGHGSREMPVWGKVFREQRDQTISTVNVYALTMYLKSIQAN